MRIIKYEKGVITINGESVQLGSKDIGKVEFYLEMKYVSSHINGSPIISTTPVASRRNKGQFTKGKKTSKKVTK